MNLQLPPPKYRTVETKECHYICRDGLPVGHSSRFVIEALKRMTTLAYRFDTNTVCVDVTEGGTGGELYEVGDGIYAVDITLDKSLKRSEQTTVACDILFDYKTPLPPEFRRVVGATGMEYLDMQVTFEGSRLPSGIWWAQWDGYGSDARIVPGTEEAVELSPMTDESDAPMNVCRTSTDVKTGVYGFRWEW